MTIGEGARGSEGAGVAPSTADEVVAEGARGRALKVLGTVAGLAVSGSGQALAGMRWAGGRVGEMVRKRAEARRQRADEAIEAEPGPDDEVDAEETRLGWGSMKPALHGAAAVSALVLVGSIGWKIYQTQRGARAPEAAVAAKGEAEESAARAPATSDDAGVGTGADPEPVAPPVADSERRPTLAGDPEAIMPGGAPLADQARPPSGSGVAADEGLPAPALADLPPTRPTELGDSAAESGPGELPDLPARPGAIVPISQRSEVAASAPPAGDLPPPALTESEAPPPVPVAEPEVAPPPREMVNPAPAAVVAAPAPVAEPAPAAAAPASESRMGNGSAIVFPSREERVRWTPLPNAGRRTIRSSVAGRPVTGSGVASESTLVSTPRGAGASTPEAGSEFAPLTSTQHVVVEGENFWTISRDYYGDGRFYRALWVANRDVSPRIEDLEVGTVIRVPPTASLDARYIDRPKTPTRMAGDAPGVERRSFEAERRPARRSSESRAESGGEYVVGPNQSLRSIARDVLGDPSRASEIEALNRDRVDGHGRVPEGTRLRLPAPLDDAGSR
jgi:nucleoid-associated protein YgaU